MASATAAWALGLSGRHDRMAWLSRAARLAPGDPRIAFDLARARLNEGTDSQELAEACFMHLAKTYDAPGAWIGLMMARSKLGDTAGAAEALTAFLSRHCIPNEPGFTVMAKAIAEQAGYEDFSGFSASMRRRPRSGARRLLVPGFDIAALTRIEGVVYASETGINGWASRPAADGAAPRLLFRDSENRTRTVRFRGMLETADSAPFLRRHMFAISARILRDLTPPFSLCSADNIHISGSPIDPAAFIQAPIPAGKKSSAIINKPQPRRLAIIVPVYRGLEETKACIAALLAVRPKNSKLIVVDDASPDRALTTWLDKLSASRKIILRRHAENRGFPAAANTGFAASAGRDVLLVNSDTMIPAGAIEALQRVAYANPKTGSVTALSNEASILSYPNRFGGNPVPDAAQTDALQRMAGRVNFDRSHEIPTAVGFCMYIRHDCLKAVGGFRPEIFAQGYGEENDWSMRARHRGYVHRVACDAFVSHIGGVSFRAAGRALVTRNLDILERLYPGYHGLVAAHIAADPLRAARRRIDAARIMANTTQPGVLLISHSHGGGVARQVATDMEALRRQKLRPLLLSTKFPEDPEATPFPWPSQLSEGDASAYPNLAYALPNAWASLIRLLRSLKITKIILHHALGHHPNVRELARALNLPQDVVIHDYACFCPRVNLLNRPDDDAALRYCGEPAPSGCHQCCARDRDEVYEPLPIADLLARSTRELQTAARVIAPSGDAARRIAKHFPAVEPAVVPWEDDSRQVSLASPARNGPRTIAVIGGIGPSKGFHVLLGCARDAVARSLDLQFVVAGTTANDEELLATGKIFVTGPYAEGEARALINSCRADLAFLPSIWPETWCFALSEAWLAGLYAVTFDLGAQAERIKATGRGITLPLGLPVHRINDILLSWQPPRSKWL